MGRIVVGVDGSESSQRALRWAADHAGPEDIIEAIMVIERPPVDWVMPLEGIPVATVDYGELEEIAGKKLARLVQDVLGAPPSVKVDENVVVGSPAAALLEASENADLLIVGSRGLGGFRGLLLGSVGHKLAGHASCPVVILPQED